VSRVLGYCIEPSRGARSRAWVVGVVLSLVIGACWPTGSAAAQDEPSGTSAALATQPVSSVLESAGSAHAQSSADLRIHLKVRRLRIAGWTLTASGALFGVGSYLVGVFATNDARALGGTIYMATASAALLITGGALLLRARFMLRRWHRHGERDEVALSLTPGGARFEWEF